MLIEAAATSGWSGPRDLSQTSAARWSRGVASGAVALIGINVSQIDQAGGYGGMYLSLGSALQAQELSWRVALLRHTFQPV